MPKLTEVDKKIVDSVMSAIDWEQILKFYKILNKKIGTEQIKIKGITKSDKVTEDAIKDELRKVLEYIIENDIPEMNYGHWVIMWINGEWESIQTIESDTNEEGEEIGIPIIESKLQVHFVAQSVTVKDEIDIPAEFFEFEGDISTDIRLKEILDEKLDQSIKSEDYGVAGKIRDLLEELKKEMK
jgi:hypothetical protein